VTGGGCTSGDLFFGLPAAPMDQGAEEQVLALVARPGVRVERIVSTGQASPPGYWYDQAEDEFVVLLAGEALLTIEGRPEPLRLTPGTWVDLPARCRHRIEWTQADPPTVWLAVFTGRG